MKSIRCGKGLGDSIYLQSVVRHLVENGESLKVMSNWPEVFKYLPVKVEPFNRAGVTIVAHYSTRKAQPTTQFDDCCINAKIKPPVDFRLDWAPTNLELLDSLRQHGRKIVCVQFARQPMDRADGFGRELLPKGEAIQKVIDAAKDCGALTVQIGAGKCLHKFSGIDVDLSNRTTVSDMLDVSRLADGFIGYPGFVIAISESFKTPGLYVWGHASKKAAHIFIRQITPKKIFQYPGLSTSFYDHEEKPEVIDAFCRRVRLI